MWIHLELLQLISIYYALFFILLRQQHSCVCNLDNISQTAFFCQLNHKAGRFRIRLRHCWRVKGMADAADKLIKVKVKRSDHGELQ